ncbi:MAG: FAD-dependent oxidoreductase [Methylobacter sp.]|nr:FAD-dependent oxidoreductase [Methylobacter sp.]MDP2428795.1 FAD-dependent oxidoreductase [Methylobacter sp.]MDP3053998.1 FAD-dependent oxidoreductase [Methylobacter sp.]MDP3361937.1 FAD-dependent oxidoreductase [Methylobacter sp.]MDZ4219712.1 FAD-dependent oxidoreductase [Methylobacter sp.]
MQIVIIGSGVAGVSFAEKYRTLAPDDEITLVTREHDGYYSRPLLSRGFSKADIEQSIILKPFERLRENNINVLCGAEVTAINRAEKSIAIEGACQEKSLPYDKLILAQGSAAFVPPPFRPYGELFFCLNSLVDLKALRKFRQSFLNQNQHPDWAIIGGGLIGCEVASDLAAAGDKVTLFHAMDRLMERQLAAEDSASLLKVLQDSGVNVLLNQAVQAFIKEDGKVCVRTDVTAEFDRLIVACGFKARTELAEQAGLETGRGIKVDPYLQTSDASIYALGDVAELPNGKLYAFVLPIRNQALWLAEFLAGQQQAPWTPPIFTTKAKVHGFEAVHPYNV